MTAEFFDYYLKSSQNRKLLLAVMNPNKFRVCQYLIRFHERRNDKVFNYNEMNIDKLFRLLCSRTMCLH